MPLTRGQKVAILVGGLAGIGLVGYLVYKYVLPTLAPPTVPTPPTPPTVPTPTPTPPPTPAPGIPVGIRSLGSVTLIQNVGVSVEGTPCAHDWFTWHPQVIRIRYYNEDWSREGLCTATIRFQVVDAASKGVPGVDVWLYTDPMPDGSRYRGVLYLDDAVHTVENPLRKRTDGAGVVSATLTYRYGLGDGFETLCKDTGMQFNVAACLYTQPLPWPTWDQLTPRDGAKVYLEGYEWVPVYVKDKRGGGEAPVTWPNLVHAQIAEVAPTGQTYAREFVYCKFRTRWV